MMTTAACRPCAAAQAAATDALPRRRTKEKEKAGAGAGSRRGPGNEMGMSALQGIIR